MFFSPLGDKRTKSLITSTRHDGEKVVLELILHSTEEEFSEEVRAHDTTSRDELIHGVVVLVFSFDHGFDLVIDGDDDGDEESSEHNSAQGDVPGHHQHQGVVNEDGDTLHPVALGEGKVNGLLFPRNVEEAIGTDEEEMLVVTPPFVLGVGRLPEVKDGFVVDVGVDTEAVGEDVVGVVLVGPPTVGEAIGDTGNDLAECHGDSVAAVGPVVAEPSGLLHTQTEHESGEDGVGSGEEPAEDEEGEGGDDIADHLIEPRAVEPTFSFELLAEGLEVTGELVTGNFFVSDGLLGHALELSDGILGVEGVEGVGGIFTVEEVQELGTTGVLVAPGSEVVLVVVDAEDGLGELGVVLVRELELEGN